jgi:hypothetical protein
MKIFVKSNKEPLCVKVTVLVAQPMKVYIRLCDKEFPLSVYTDRFATIEHEETFFIRMPISPSVGLLEVSSSPNFDDMGNKGFKVVDLEKLPLKRNLGAFNSASPVVRDFIRFAEKFSTKASYLSANNSIYTSNDGQFRIDYLDTIVGPGGRALNTPARINKHTAIIQVSKMKFMKYTIPMRMAILLHEFSHYYLNNNIKNETEADLNALIIYLGLGYPRIDAYNVFTTVFAVSDNVANRDRLNVIDDFIRKFDRKYVEMTYENNNH